MTGNSCLLDTCVVIHAFKRNNDIAGRLDEMSEVYVPVVVIGELYSGAYKSAYPAKHINQLRLFLMNCTILFSDATTADFYGKIKLVLTSKGKPIPENDIWIEATATQYNLPLFTTDSHFKEIDNIILL